jgi:hypothetical protein
MGLKKEEVETYFTLTDKESIEKEFGGKRIVVVEGSDDRIMDTGIEDSPVTLGATKKSGLYGTELGKENHLLNSQNMNVSLPKHHPFEG